MCSKVSHRQREGASYHKAPHKKDRAGFHSDTKKSSSGGHDRRDKRKEQRAAEQQIHSSNGDE